jgi:hypothetical protein
MKARRNSNSDVPVYHHTTEEGVLKVAGCRDSLSYMSVSELDASQTCLNKSQIVVSIEKNCRTMIIRRNSGHHSQEYMKHNYQHSAIDSTSNYVRKKADKISEQE